MWHREQAACLSLLYDGMSLTGRFRNNRKNLARTNSIIKCQIKNISQNARARTNTFLVQAHGAYKHYGSINRKIVLCSLEHVFSEKDVKQIPFLNSKYVHVNPTTIKSFNSPNDPRFYMLIINLNPATEFWNRIQPFRQIWLNSLSKIIICTLYWVRLRKKLCIWIPFQVWFECHILVSHLWNTEFLPLPSFAASLCGALSCK